MTDLEKAGKYDCWNYLRGESHWFKLNDVYNGMIISPIYTKKNELNKKMFFSLMFSSNIHTLKCISFKKH
jgi:hypothetical protein